MSNDIIKEELIAAREEYVKAVKTELMGPGSEFSFPDSEHELISARDRKSVV